MISFTDINIFSLLASGIISALLGAGLLASGKKKSMSEGMSQRNLDQRRYQTLGIVLCLISLVILHIVSPSLIITYGTWIFSIILGFQLNPSVSILKTFSFILVLLTICWLITLDSQFQLGDFLLLFGFFSWILAETYQYWRTLRN